MGKYIWPHNISQASKWYLSILKELKRGSTVEELLVMIMKDELPRKAGLNNDILRRDLYRLSQTGLVKKSGRGHLSKYAITSAGIDRLEQLSFRNHSFTSQTWDGQWRIVIFDIPEDRRGARDQVRRLLKELHFMQLQLSVWIHPLPVLDEFKKIQMAYGLEDHLQLIETKAYDPPQHIRRQSRNYMRSLGIH